MKKLNDMTLSMNRNPDSYRLRFYFEDTENDLSKPIETMFPANLGVGACVQLLRKLADDIVKNSYKTGRDFSSTWEGCTELKKNVIGDACTNRDKRRIAAEKALSEKEKRKAEVLAAMLGKSEQLNTHVDDKDLYTASVIKDAAWSSLKDNAAKDSVEHPPHYTNHPSGVECIHITQHMNFCLGNAIKYIWRADLKADAVEDLRKAKWYIEHEITKRLKDNG